jgi:hypothetical protein
MDYGTKFCRLCLKLLLPTILTSSLPFYPYQKDERALPGYLLTRCSFSPSDIKRRSLSPTFSLYFYSFSILSDSLSLIRLETISCIHIIEVSIRFQSIVYKSPTDSLKAINISSLASLPVTAAHEELYNPAVINHPLPV